MNIVSDIFMLLS